MNENLLQVKQNIFCRNIFGEDAVLTAEYDPDTGEPSKVNTVWVDQIDSSLEPTLDVSIVSSDSSLKPTLTVVNNSGKNALSLNIKSKNYKYIVLDLSSIDDVSNRVLYDPSAGNQITTEDDAEKTNPVITLVGTKDASIDVNPVIYVHVNSSAQAYKHDLIINVFNQFYIMPGGIVQYYNGDINVIKSYELDNHLVKANESKLYRNSIVEMDTPCKSDVYLMPEQRVFFSSEDKGYDSDKGVYDYKYDVDGRIHSYHWVKFNTFNTKYINLGSTVLKPYTRFIDTNVTMDSSIHVYGDDFYSSTDSTQIMVPPTILKNVLYEVAPIAYKPSKLTNDLPDNQTFYLKPTVKI